jgi:hypothetical protein
MFAGLVGRKGGEGGRAGEGWVEDGRETGGGGGGLLVPLRSEEEELVLR